MTSADNASTQGDHSNYRERRIWRAAAGGSRARCGVILCGDRSNVASPSDRSAGQDTRALGKWIGDRLRAGLADLAKQVPGCCARLVG